MASLCLCSSPLVTFLSSSFVHRSVSSTSLAVGPKSSTSKEVMDNMFNFDGLEEDEEEFNDPSAPRTLNDPIDIRVRNVVCNYTLPLHIDLRKVAMNCGNVTFDRGRGVLLKQMRNPHCFVKIYSSGKVYIVGCRSEAECMQAARRIARKVQKNMGRTEDTVRIRNYKICNVLATCRMPFGVRIGELAAHFPQAQYEPELSPGLIWRSQNPKCVLRVHTTGTITVTGASSEMDVQLAIEMIYPIVYQFRAPAQRP
uniref:TATA box-binding protein-like 1 n=1 Tax=Steinernema glaseri TaxID=37863 RepID=A0A1I7Z4W3_9BILA